MEPIEDVIKFAINYLVDEIHNHAVKFGFYENKDEPEHNVVIRQILLIITELCEAVEAYRKNGKGSRILTIDAANNISMSTFKENVKDNFFDEIADALIRIFDLLGYLDFDIVPHIIAKMRYNETREYKHGKSF